VIARLNNKHKKTLRAVFDNPVRSNIVWKDIERLFTAFGATVSQREGSRVAVLLNDVAAVFHEPHPEKETDKGAVKAVREFLKKAGVEDEHINL